MQWRRIALVFGLLFSLQFTTLSAAQIVVTHTRFQMVLGSYERQWLKAVQDKDPAALDGILSEDFEIWTPTPPGNPRPREDWQKEAFARKLQFFQLQQLAAKVVSADTVIASFVLTETFNDDGKQETEEHFVADVWKNSGKGDHWKCTDRYIWLASPMAQPEAVKPEVKPTGKD